MHLTEQEQEMIKGWGCRCRAVFDKTGICWDLFQADKFWLYLKGKYWDCCEEIVSRYERNLT